MLEFIKNYYQYIIVGVVVLVLLVLVLINIFKKPKNTNTDVIDSILSPTKERGLKKAYNNEFVIFKRGIQDYYIYLFNKESKVVFRSEVYSSLLTLKDGFERIKSAILNNKWHLNVLLNDLVYLKFNDELNGKSLGYSRPFNEKELDEVYNEIEDLFKTLSLGEDVTKDLTLLTFKIKGDDLPKKRVKNSWIYKQIEDEYYYTLLNDDKVSIFNTECFWSKKELKKSLQLYKDSIRSGNFLIDRLINDKYVFYLLDFNKNTLFISNELDSVEECEIKIKEIIHYA